ncbi:acyl-CoA reductase-like NAD-dependent aldehyde dehydrogenase [Streptosporangium becharense]|uniref:Acyl-CoA reductase-like NAD-dependent aldehyde dehydrogenase n=1 Tax=Streptosporangium becharense TaxID=1816182 RepID=A0A7W9IJK1_9ACTN|nr:aldehyde dehydrogenase family protein [Streptosporangium becharense]MBB2911047.1 acyl-CoA reductase-like NAD-dependent aldehyde dehydrogenase [Streptosporangium becharense]MBB5821895.1 acyl-CoA reductase-like NAD-dependent aldehyde dehydrogenase [Streptosporangium becharense]
MTRPPGGLLPLDALGAKGPYRSQNRLTVADVTGEGVAELSLVPPLFVGRTVTALREASPPPPDERAALLTRAARLFATAELGGQSAEDYRHAVSRVGGVPISVVRTAAESVAARLSRVYESVQQARPTGTVNDWRDPLTRTGRGVWLRRGEVFAVHAAGNHPGTHSLWPEALAMGYRVAVRPSRRDPFTPHRIVTALRAAGFGDDQVALLPTDHDRADALLRDADLGLVYGGEDVVRKYAGDPAVLLQGPGRSKMLLTADVDWRDHLDTIADSVSGHGGTGCVNTTAVFVQGDPAPLCAALAERLAGLVGLPPQEEKAVLPVLPAAAARAVEAHLLHRAAGTRPWLGGDGVVDELGDGSAALRPAVHQLDRPDAPQAGVELPFPCVWVAPWTPRDGIAPLRNSLVLTAVTHDDRLLDRLVTEPTIGNVYTGDHRTYEMRPGLPHDGYLAEFLMRSKSVIRD